MHFFFSGLPYIFKMEVQRKTHYHVSREVNVPQTRLCNLLDERTTPSKWGRRSTVERSLKTDTGGTGQKLVLA